MKSLLRRSRTRNLASAALLLLAVTGVRAARADVSSWFELSGGATRLTQGSVHDYGTLLSLQTGLGSAPSGRWIVGGLARAQIYPGTGTDLSLLGRVTTQGFSNGDWGLAFDLGPMQRWWAPQSTALLGDVSLGMPWGLTLTAGGSYGTSDTSGVFATFGVDLLRLTVYRRTGDTWWRNTFPAYRPEEGR